MLRLMMKYPDNTGHYDAVEFDDDGNIMHFVEGWTADADNEAYEETYFYPKLDTLKISKAYAMLADHRCPW